MMHRRDVEAIARSVSAIIRELQTKSEIRLAAIERRLEDVAQASKQIASEPVNEDAIVMRAAELIESRIPKPQEIDEKKIITRVLNELPPVFNGKDGKDGADGKDGVSVDAKAIIAEIVAQIPAPSEVDVNAIVSRVLGEIHMPDVERLVDEAVAKIPKPAEINQDEIVIRVLNQLPPPPKDGRDGRDAERVNVDEIVAQVLAQVPKPENGRDADEDAIIARVMSQIRVPVDGKDGRDAEPIDIERLITLLYDRVDVNKIANRAASLIPTPRDGKDAKEIDVAEVVTMINHAVEDAVKRLPPVEPPSVDHDLIIKTVLEQIPTPQPGRGVTVDDCLDVIHDSVARAVSELPRAKDGQDGKDGAPGPPGESVHPDTLQVMIRRALDEVIERIPKPINGKDGESVHPDTIQLMVSRAVAEAVAQIPLPQPGRDAVQIEILPGIDASKSYPPRTYARHNGGTWMSVRQTTAGESVDISEWLCVWDSLSKVEVEQLADFRTIRIKTIQASGDFDVHEFKVPVMLNAGAFKQGNLYERGDVVTRDGSSWVCEVEQTSAVPGMSKDWRMLVRKGDKGESSKSGNGNGGGHSGPISLK